MPRPTPAVTEELEAQKSGNGTEMSGGVPTSLKKHGTTKQSKFYFMPLGEVKTAQSSKARHLKKKPFKRLIRTCVVYTTYVNQ